MKKIPDNYQKVIRKDRTKMYSNSFTHDERLYDDEQLEIIQRNENIFVFLILTIILPLGCVLLLVLILLFISSRAGFEFIITLTFALFGIFIVFLFCLYMTRKFFIFRSTKRVSLRCQFLMNPILVANFPEIPFQMNNQNFTLSCKLRDSERVSDMPPLCKYTSIKPKSVVKVDTVSPQVLIILGQKITFSLNTLIEDPRKKWFLPCDLIIHIHKIQTPGQNQEGQSPL